MFERARERLAGLDPGGFSGRAAVRATVGMTATAALGIPATGYVGAPPTLAMGGAVLAMLSALAVADPDVGAQRVTLVLGFAAAAATATLATLAAPHVIASGVGLCAIVFVAVVARARGPRGMALGMLAFMGYFVALFAHAQPASLPAFLGAIALGAVVAYVLRFAIIRERPARVRASVLRAFRWRIGSLLDEIAADAASGARSERRWRRIRRATGGVNELALALEEAVGGGKGDEPPHAARVWLGELLRAEVALDMLAHAWHRLAAEAATGRLRSLLAETILALRPWLRTADEAARQVARSRFADAFSRDDRPHDRHALWWRGAVAIHTLTDARPWARFPDVAPCRSNVSIQSFRAGGGGVTGLHGRPNVRLAVQATVATAIAMIAGRLISPVRWYWAVLAAFVVYVRAMTVGETLSRAWQRSLGTVVGVFAGLGLAALVGTHVAIVIPVGLVAVCLAYFLVRVWYPAMIACFTIVLSLLYSLLHQPVPGLLELRLLETVCGAAIGVAVAAFLLPSHSSQRIRTLVSDVARAAAETIPIVTTRTQLATPDSALQDAIRHVDRALAELRNAVRPLWGPNVPFEPRSTRPARGAAALAYATRSFAMAPPLPDAAARELGRRAGEVLAHDCRAIADGTGVIEDTQPSLRALGNPNDPGAPPFVVLLDELARAVGAIARQTIMPSGKIAA